MTRPDLPPTAPPSEGVVPGEPIVQAPVDPEPPTAARGVPAAAAPTRKPRAPRRRGRVIGAVGDSPDTPDTPADAASATPGEAPSPPAAAANGAGGNGVAPAVDGSSNGAARGGGAQPGPTSRRRSLSARLGAVPDAPAPVAAGPEPAAVPDAPSSSPQPLDPPQADSTDPVLLVPEVLAPTAPAPRILPAMPEIVPGVSDEQPQPPPVLPETEAALYDLAADDPALAFETPTRVRRRRPRVRRVTRVVRTVDTWSVFKVATLFAAVLYVSGLLSGVLLWNVAYATGTVDNAERFMESFGWQTFEFKGGEIFHDAWIIGMFAAAGLVGLAVLAAATFNLVSDLVGGVRVTVLEEEMVVRPVTRRRKQRIRKAPPRAATTAPAPPDAPSEPGTDLVARSDNLPAR